MAVKGIKKAKTLKTLTTPKTVKYSGAVYEVVTIMENACIKSKALSSVSIKADLDEIGTKAFSDCPVLENLYIKGDVLKINDKAFYKCKSLQKIEISTNELIDIGRKAFARIKSSAKVYVPKNKMTSYKKLLSTGGLPKTAKVKTL